ncbi:tetratricopeptide repeat protein [Thalassotalea sp. G2M2-11]|uniref:tetratricopeptide repeat protein n=1 Tax=Thalassotalea sp. G2M2-11 TaxID=2787627 RepID=UPI0019D1C36E|nr:tetratricopeptide repeat protein [Thalassotalea sp. G2M2-11]
MNDLLLSELHSEQEALLASLVLIQEHIFDEVVSIDALVAPIIKECQLSITGIDDSMAQAECLINELYVGQLLLDNDRLLWPVIAQKLNKAVEYKLIAPVLKAALIQHVANACQLEAELVYVPEKVMVRIICDDMYSIIFDPISGESLSGQELDQRLDELSGEPSQTFLPQMERQSIIVEYLSALKASLINELQFDKALKCVDLLLALRPDDPFERRDRGFLLHQLDCFKVAYDDYQYFVKECPQDPAAQLLKLQLDKITLTETVLH